MDQEKVQRRLKTKKDDEEERRMIRGYFEECIRKRRNREGINIGKLGEQGIGKIKSRHHKVLKGEY